MNQKDMYEDDESFMEAKFVHDDSHPMTEMDQYLLSAEYMDSSVQEVYFLQSDEDLAIKEINILRKTGHLANSSFYPDVFEMSLARTSIPGMIKKYQKLVSMNKNFFKKLGMQVIVTPESYMVQCVKSGEIVLDYPNFLPDTILAFEGITKDNQADYHFLAGYLLTAKNFNLIQLGNTILATEETLAKLSK